MVRNSGLAGAQGNVTLILGFLLERSNNEVKEKDLVLWG